VHDRQAATARDLIEIADELRALARAGLHFSQGHYDRERYEKTLALAVRLATLAARTDPREIERLFCESDHGYITPKLDVRMAVFRGDQVLLVRERQDGRWSLPGGYVDVGDSPVESAVRETWEEAGVHVRASRLVGIFDRRVRPESPPHLFHIHKVVFTGELTDPEAEPRAGEEVLEACFQPAEHPPELSLGRTLPFHLQEALRVARDPNALPYFE
jgi:8-oxo-dGTP pyrophosphatase MutT (NUDIX family)